MQLKFRKNNLTTNGIAKNKIKHKLYATFSVEIRLKIRNFIFIKMSYITHFLFGPINFQENLMLKIKYKKFSTKNKVLKFSNKHFNTKS